MFYAKTFQQMLYLTCLQLTTNQCSVEFPQLRSKLSC